MSQKPVSDVILAHVFLLIDSIDGVTKSTLCEKLELSKATLGSALTELRFMGCVESERVGKYTLHYSTGHGCEFCK